MADIERIFSSVVRGAKSIGDFLARNPQVIHTGKRFIDETMNKGKGGGQKKENTTDDLKNKDLLIKGE